LYWFAGTPADDGAANLIRAAASAVADLPSTCATPPRSSRARTRACCIGNRVYTGMTDNRLCRDPRPLIEAVNQPAIVKANTKLEQFHRQRASIGDEAL
jgi:hypothetical protein